MKMSTEKVIDSMGKTTHFKVKTNDKTCMKLDKETLVEEMSKIKNYRKTQDNDGLLSRMLGFVTKGKSK